MPRSTYRQRDGHPRPVHIGAVHRLGVRNPEPVVCGHVEHRVATLQSRSDRIRLREIARMRLTRDSFKIGKLACLADEKPQVRALSGKFASNMMAYKAGRACYKHFHREGQGLRIKQQGTEKRHTGAKRRFLCLT